MQVSEALFPSKTTQIQNRYSATPAALPAAPQFLVRRSCHRGALATTPGSPVSRHSQSSRLWGRSRHAASTPSPFGRIRPRPLALKHQSVPTFSVEGSVTNRPTPVAVPSPIQHMHNIQKLQPPRRQEHVLRKRNSRVKWSRKNALAPKPSPGCRLSAQISARYKDLVLTMISVRGGNEGSFSRNGRRHQGCFSPAGDRQLTKKEDGCNIATLMFSLSYGVFSGLSAACMVCRLSSRLVATLPMVGRRRRGAPRCPPSTTHFIGPSNPLPRHWISYQPCSAIPSRQGRLVGRMI